MLTVGCVVCFLVFSLAHLSQRFLVSRPPLLPLTLLSLLQLIAKAWYIDGLHFAGPTRGIAILIPALRKHLAVGNMALAPNKQHFYSPSPFTNCSALLDLISGRAMVWPWWGGPIGSPDYMQDFLIKFLAKYSAAIDSLALLIFDYPQEALCLFMFCVIPSVNHIFCSVPLGPLHNFPLKIREFDKVFILHLLCWPCLHTDLMMDKLCWQLVHQPMRCGGLGIRDPTLVAPQAYLASWGSVLRTAAV